MKAIYGCLILTVLIFQTLLMLSMPVNTTSDPSCDETWISVSINIEYGKGENCRGRGICGMSIDIYRRSTISAFDDGDGNIEIVFSEFAYKQSSSTQFIGGIFLMEENYTLDDSLSNALGSHIPIILKSGSYPVIKAADGYHVKLKK